MLWLLPGSKIFLGYLWSKYMPDLFVSPSGCFTETQARISLTYLATQREIDTISCERENQQATYATRNDKQESYRA